MAVHVLKLFKFLVLYYTLFSMTATPKYSVNDEMSQLEKLKMLNLSEALVKESILKMRQIFQIRAEYKPFTSFNVGILMGKIREKYRNMVETYRDVMDNHKRIFNYNVPGINERHPLHYIIALEMIHYFEVEIDKLIDIMVDFATDDLTNNRVIAGLTTRRRFQIKKHIQKPGLRTRDAKDRIREEAEKSKLRQSFLMKRLGQPANMTTAKKRFIRQWPVEETWALHKYNYNY